MSSIFSKIIAGAIPSYKIAESEDCYAFLDITPLAKGHTLVVPKKETDYLFDIADPSYTSLLLFSKKVAAALKKSIPCNRIGVAVVGLEVPHAHIHLIPINHISDMSFSKPRLEITSQEFEQIAKSIREVF